MTRRRSLSTRERARLFTLHGGICHLCGGLIDGTREAWEVSHDIPLEMGGADDDANRRPAHKKCHRDHTARVDIPAIAKAKRREARHIGALRPAGKIPNRPFAKAAKEPRSPTPEKLAGLPRPRLYGDAQ
jgi:5-methylcytosine-specific restriction endonuclease McrA